MSAALPPLAAAIGLKLACGAIAWSMGDRMSFRFLSSIVAASLIALSFGSAAQARPIDRTVTVQVFQVCDDDYANCAARGDLTFAQATNDIWSQAGIGISFNFVQQLNESTYLSIDNTPSSGHTFDDLAANFGAHGASSSIIPLFLVRSIGGAYGQGYVNFGGLALAMDAVLADNRFDALAHELGHNFGLVPTSWSASNHSSDPYDLMADGNIRIVGSDLLTEAEIDYARGSRLLTVTTPVPEPGEWAMLLLGLGVTGAAARRRQLAA